MRTLLLTAALVLVAFIIKIDLMEGSLPLASFYPQEESTNCEEVSEPQTIFVEVIEGDTIHSLFALHPAKSPMTFPERLELFYKLNPHLQLQAFQPGEKVKLPLALHTKKSCGK
ncbi:MAG: hypothetical protein RR595_02560 [Lysinibacillus sp.]